MGDQSDVRDRVEDEETRSRTLSDAPLAILQRPRQPEFSPACMHTRPGNRGRSRCFAPMCLAPTANHHLLRIVRGPASLKSAATTRPSSEDESVASTPLQEKVFRPTGWSQCSHTTVPASVLNVVVVRRSGRTTQEIRQTTGWLGLTAPMSSPAVRWRRATASHLSTRRERTDQCTRSAH
jgi:hypothetical protein